jgi:CheY-like chemotaxis protein
MVGVSAFRCRHEVQIARDGMAALDVFPRYRPDVVLLDLAMPRMSGYELAQQLPRLAPDRKPLIVAVTWFADPESRRRSAEAGIDLHLVKPVDTDRLFGLLARVRPSAC